jgi:LysM repeat protein
MAKALGVVLLVLSLLATACLGQTSSDSKSKVVTIITPINGEVIAGKEYIFKVGFQSDSKHPISKIQVFLDGDYISELAFTTPQVRGTCLFKWDTLRTPDGRHRLDIQAVSNRTVLGSDSCEVVVANNTSQLSIPRVALISPRNGDVVSGIVPIEVKVSNGTGEVMVSIVIDQSVRLLKNRPPYTYQWDTTKESNGPHSVEVTAIDSANNKVSLQPIRVIVRNPQAPVSQENEGDSKELVERATVPSLSDVIPSGRIKSTSRIESQRASSSVSGESVEIAARVTQVAQTPGQSNSAQPQTSKSLVEQTVSKVSQPANTTSSTNTAVADSQKMVNDLPAPRTNMVSKLTKSSAASTSYQEASNGQKVASVEYIVKPGDSVLKLAKRFNVLPSAIVELNMIKDPSLIRVGDVLHIPLPPKLVWIKPVFNREGGVVLWDQAKREVYAVRPGQEVRFKIGESVATVNDSQVAMDYPATIKSGRTMVSENFIKHTLGLDVGE